MDYTKGKWSVNKDNRQMVVIENKAGFKPTPQSPIFIIAQTSLYTSPKHEECLGNAQLISAAPDMYEALKAILDVTLFSDEPIKDNATWQAWRRKAVKAVNKAEGK